MSEMPRNCPECLEDLPERVKRCKCGWAPPPELSEASNRVRGRPPIDPDRLRCEHVEPMGERCKAIGAVSLRGGPWLCWPHAAPSWQAWKKGEIPESFRLAKEALQRSAARRAPVDFEAELERAAIQEEGQEREP